MLQLRRMEESKKMGREGVKHGVPSLQKVFEKWGAMALILNKITLVLSTLLG